MAFGKRVRVALVAILAGIACAPPVSASYTPIPSFELYGRIAVSEPHACDMGQLPNPLEANTAVTWQECHADKQHMDAGGRPITSNVFEPDALRPLQVTIQVEAWCLYGGQSYGDPQPMVSVRVRSSADGRFIAKLPKSHCGVWNQPGDGLVVRTSAWLEYRVDDASGVPLGTVRAVWDATAAATVYTSTLPMDPPLWGNWVTPHLILGQQVFPLPFPTRVNLGNLAFFNGTGSYETYVRAMLGAWQTAVNLHERLQAELAVDGHQALQHGLYVTDPATACTSCYTLYLDSGAGHSSAGSMAMRGPAAYIFDYQYRQMITIDEAARQFGLSMLAAMAPAANVPIDLQWTMLEMLGGAVFDGRASQVGGNLQSQDTGMALVGGFAIAMGYHFLGGRPYRGWGDPDPAHAYMNPLAHFKQDNIDFYCPYHYFRFQMTERGIIENSPDWNARLAAMDTIASAASNKGAINVLSNNEGKVGLFLADLLDDDPDVSYASGWIGGRTYVVNFDWIAAEALDGRARNIAFATYGADPPPETIHLSIGTLLDALQAFIPPYAVPGTLPSPIVDGAQGPYNDARMSIYGPYSARSLASYLVNRGIVTQADINGILAGNRMEELP